MPFLLAVTSAGDTLKQASQNHVRNVTQHQKQIQMEPIFTQCQYVPGTSKTLYGHNTKSGTHPVLTLVPTSLGRWF